MNVINFKDEKIHAEINDLSQSGVLNKKLQLLVIAAK